MLHLFLKVKYILKKIMNFLRDQKCYFSVIWNSEVEQLKQAILFWS